MHRILETMLEIWCHMEYNGNAEKLLYGEISK